MKTNEALKIVGGLSKPSKMPGWAYGLPAAECKTGSKLAKVPGSVCSGCYALKGCYVFPVVQAAQYRRLEAIRSPLWVVQWRYLLIVKNQKNLAGMTPATYRTKSTYLKIFAVAKLTPQVKHWMPTREAWVKHFLPECPANLVIRFSGQMIDQPAIASWPHTSTVSTKPEDRTCPAPDQNNECGTVDNAGILM